MAIAKRQMVVSIFGAGLLLTACSDDTPLEVEDRIRAIKPYYVSQPSNGDARRYSGTVAATNTSAMSFAVAGTVQTVDVNQGDQVVQGQVLATLDPDQYELDVQAAEAQLNTAQANYDAKRTDLDRQRQLYEKEWVAKAAYDQAVAAFESAEGDLNLARSRLGTAERDLGHTSLTAPFDGVISLRDVDPFTEVTKGQPIFRIDSQGAFEVDLSIPDSVIGRLSVGAPVTLDVSTVTGCGCTGRITEIGTTAGSANTVPVTAAILQSTAGLLPGMAVEATIVLADATDETGFLVPLTAIAPGDETAQGYVFKYADGTVKKTAVRGGDGVSSKNYVSVLDGVQAGDVVAAAGVSFLRDGQKVKLLGE